MRPGIRVRPRGHSDGIAVSSLQPRTDMPPQENLRPSSLVVRGLSYAAVISAAFVAVACSDVPDDAGQHPHSGASVGAAASAPTPFLPPSSGSSSQGDAATPPAAPTPP